MSNLRRNGQRDVDKVREQLRRIPWWGWVALGLGVMVAIWLTVWLGKSCSVPGRRLVMKAIGGQGGGGGVGCFEFWFYRYQGLVAAIVALGAAIIAVRPVWVQLAEMRKQSAEMARQSAQQAFQTLRTLRVQLAEEEIIVRDIDIAAKNARLFEDNIRENLEGPAFAKVHHKDLEERFEELRLLDRALRESGAKAWGSRKAGAARARVLNAIIKLRQGILRVKQGIYSVTYRFDGPYVVADWERECEPLLSLGLKAEATELSEACSVLFQEILAENGRIEPALREATHTAFGFS